MYTILINKDTNKATVPVESESGIRYSTDFWRAIENINEDDLITTCQQEGCDYSEVEAWLKDRKLNENLSWPLE